MNKALSLCLGVLMATCFGVGLAHAGSDTPFLAPVAQTDEGTVLLAHHFGNRPDELFEPANVHGGDYSDSVDPNPDMPVEPENRPYIDPGTDQPDPPGQGNMGPPSDMPRNPNDVPDTAVQKGRG